MAEKGVFLPRTAAKKGGKRENVWERRAGAEAFVRGGEDTRAAFGRAKGNERGERGNAWGRPGAEATGGGEAYVRAEEPCRAEWEAYSLGSRLWQARITSPGAGG